MSGPVASRLMFLNDLPRAAPGAKVRFLGCVSDYSVATGALKLEHGYPAGESVSALVDVRLLLESLGSAEAQVGAWINVVGYVVPLAWVDGAVRVQAVLLWPAGSVNLGEYERALEERLELEASGG